MKSTLLATCFGLLVAAFAMTSSCSISHRSNEFECADQACPSGRICQAGLCIETAAIDAGTHVVDAGSAVHVDAGSGSDCPDTCSTCNVGNKQCTVDCSQSNCAGPITCPTGWNCDIKCSSPSSCSDLIDCSAAASCQVECTGDNSCNDVECGDSRCEVTCTGANACNDVACNDSCACDVTCNNDAACNEVLCTFVNCETATGCSSTQRAVCHTCPAGN